MNSTMNDQEWEQFINNFTTQDYGLFDDNDLFSDEDTSDLDDLPYQLQEQAL